MSLAKQIKENIRLPARFFKAPNRLNTIVLLGDSRTAQCGYSLDTIPITHSGTTATATKASHGIPLGGTFYVGNCTYPEYAGMHTCTARDTNTFSWEMTGTPAGNETVAVITGQQGYKDKGYFTWANPELGGRLNLLANLGLSGDTAMDIEARVGDVLTYKPRFCAVWDGYNSYSYVVGTLTLGVPDGAAAIIASLENVYNTLLSAGIIVIAITDTPLHSTQLGTSNIYQKIQCIVNDWIRWKARTTDGMILVDFYAATLNGTSATAAPATGILGSDNIHLSPLGARACGHTFYTALEPFVPAGNTLGASIVDSYFNINGTTRDAYNNNVLRNGMMQTGAGGTGPGTGVITGTLAEGWTVATVGTVTSVGCTSEVARSDGIGYDQQLDIVPGGANCQVQLYSATITVASGAIAVGDRVYLEFDLSLSGNANLWGVYAYLATNVGGTPNISPIFHEGATNYDTTDWLNKVYRSSEFTLPAGTTQLFAWLRFYFSAASGNTQTIKVGRAVVRKVVQ